jgi:hypothetical protein
VTLAAAWAGGQPVTGIIGLGVMAGFGLLVLLAGRSETVRGLGSAREGKAADMSEDSVRQRADAFWMGSDYAIRAWGRHPGAST